MSEQCACGGNPKACPAASSAGQNGKGDTPRNISAKFRKNYDTINWSQRRLKSGQKFVKSY